MFDEAVRASEAMRISAGRMLGTLIPALKGCAHCRTVQMIAAPMLGVCADCGENLKVLGSNNLQG